MAIPQSRQELIDAIQTSYQKLNNELVTIPVGLVQEASMDGHAQGTMMSVHNLLSYLVGWGQLVLKWQGRMEQGLPVDFPETGYRWNDLGRLAQHFYQQYAGIPYPELQGMLSATVDQIMAVVTTQTDEALYGKPWYKHYTLGRMIQLNTASPYKNALGRLRQWKRDKR